MGGPDAEHEVSLASGAAVAAALTEAGWCVCERVIGLATAREIAEIPADVIFPVLHGPWGEGGPLQTLLEQDGRPFVGSTAATAAVCMNKSLVKHKAQELGIQTPSWVLAQQGESIDFNPPAIVKPNDDGSSIDLHRCSTQDELSQAAQQMTTLRGSALVESWIRGRELTVGLLGNETLPIIEIIPADGLYDYEAKYTRNDTRYDIDPDLPAGVASAMLEASQVLCQRLGVRDIARVDFLVDSGGCWMLEVNTMPGFTDHSLLPMAARASGLSMPEICHRLGMAAAARGSASRTAVSRRD